MAVRAVRARAHLLGQIQAFGDVTAATERMLFTGRQDCARNRCERRRGNDADRHGLLRGVRDGPCGRADERGEGRIATASELVDDNAEEEHVEFGDGGRLDLMPTAHHTLDTENRNEEMQRKVWVPFHFIPGNRGRTVAERLVCRKDSAIAREVVDHAVRMANRAFGPQLIGITAHVYADTFSHYGFSGASCPVNRVDTGQSGPIDDDEAAVEARRNRDKFAGGGDVEHDDGGHWWPI